MPSRSRTDASVRSESELLAWLRSRAPRRNDIRIGIGDDAALWQLGPRQFVVATTDTIVEGVDFHAGTSPELLARKALGINLSDLSAMGGADRMVALINVCVPRRGGAACAQNVLSALLKEARRLEIAVIGGDCSSTRGPLTLTVTLMGNRADSRVITRFGAHSGDGIWVTGPLGGSALGRHLTPPNRLALSRELARDPGTTAMIDISDGLAVDLDRMIAPLGLGATLFARHIPISPDARRLARRDRRSPLEHALYDGEDFELCFTSRHHHPKAFASSRVARGLKLVGIVHLRPGLYFFDHPGRAPRRLRARGFDHFASSPR